jgi:hypothetical protein
MPSATRYAPSSLTRGLIDDAAIFPPGLAPLAEAVAAHRALRRSALSDRIGPFLLRASWWQEFTALDAASDDVEVVLICRPDEDAREIDAAVRGLTEVQERPVRLRGIELPWVSAAAEGVSSLLAGRGDAFTVAFEIGGTAPDVDLAAIARCDPGSHVRIVGKFRTGGTRPEDSPSPERLAGVIAAAARQRVPVKFTAGLHHAVTGAHGPGGSIQYGVINVIAAVQQAISLVRDSHDAALVDALSATLMRTDATTLASESVSLTAGEADAIRDVFTSFGCCGVTEPLAEMAALGVVPDRPEGPQA